MENTKEDEKIVLPQHEQQKLCVTRLPYRQGRKLTAVKVYSIATESNHLLIFGVPSLNLRQETKALFIRFGKLLQFNISKNHPAEPFTETFHAQYERIQSARIAKRMLDTKNFYGGSLHVCYAPELESLNETKQKLIQRQNDVLFRLGNLKNEEEKIKREKKSMISHVPVNESKNCDKSLLNMGESNVILTRHPVNKTKRKINTEQVIEKRFKPCFITQPEVTDTNKSNGNDDKLVNITTVKKSVTDIPEVEIIDATLSNVNGKISDTTISNIDEALNYDRFGNETVFKVPDKPVNKIKFNVNKTSHK